jgi:hypothetical protein
MLLWLAQRTSTEQLSAICVYVREVLVTRISLMRQEHTWLANWTFSSAKEMSENDCCKRKKCKWTHLPAVRRFPLLQPVSAHQQTSVLSMALLKKIRMKTGLKKIRLLDACRDVTVRLCEQVLYPLAEAFRCSFWPKSRGVTAVLQKS